MDNRYTDNSYMLDAKKLIELGMAGAALMTCRNALEMLVKDLSKRCGLQYDSRETDLSVMIDTLFSSNIIGADIKDLLHRVRMTCNKAAHADNEVTLTEAQETYIILSECILRVKGRVSEEIMEQAYKLNNRPMPNPDYYSRNRRYYSKWAHCIDRQSLLVIPEYVELEARAWNDDTEAKLDLASGFLPQNIVWSSDKQINMPSYIYRGEAYNQDKAYDMRYYFWIMSAVSDAYWDMDTFPRKYIATAIWEGLNMWFNLNISPEYKNYVAGVNEWYDNDTRQYQHQPIYADPFVLTKEMFNQCDEVIRIFFNFGIKINAISVAREIFGDITQCDFVSPIYEEARSNPLLKLRFLRYCKFAQANECEARTEEEKYRLSALDAEEMNNDYRMLSELQGGAPIREVYEGESWDWDMLIPYTIGSFCNEKYNQARYFGEKIIKQRRPVIGKLAGEFRNLFSA